VQTATAAFATTPHAIAPLTQSDSGAATPATSETGSGAHLTPTAGLSWRELQKGLWVVRSDDRHVGIIERGRRFSVTDANETTTKGFPTFAHALDALGAPTKSAPAPAPASVGGRARSAALRSSALAGALGVGLGTIGLMILH